ncbi:hypothetical protein Fmac_000584 [Flemingia macrophylla]|uniref:RWP-RK domain-containing protein n=1 Tax=Flemingia macrophylla TaxID=520843 RepID=A0ABD1NEP2_9FABA
MDSGSEFRPFDTTILPNYLEEDPLVYISNAVDIPNEQPLQQQNVPFGVQRGNNNVLLPDPVIQNQPNEEGVIANFEACSSSTMRVKEHMMQDQFMHDSDNFFNGGTFFQPEFENVGPLIHQHEHMMSLPNWPPSPKPFFCSCCQVLRQIIHTNGSRFDKLEIHGTIGMISHAIIQNITPGDPTTNYQMVEYVLINSVLFYVLFACISLSRFSLLIISSVNLLLKFSSFCLHLIINAHFVLGAAVAEITSFCNRNKDEIKSFLKQYCEQKNTLGYIIMDDPLAAYYDALSTGMDWAQDISDEDDDLIPENDAEQDQEAEPEPENEMASNARRLQRERVAKMAFGDLSDYFHIPIKETAKLLEVSTSVVKKICRKADLYRWPQRKVKSNMRKIAVLRRGLDNPGTREKTRVEIQRLQQEMVEYCAASSPSTPPSASLADYPPLSLGPNAVSYLLLFCVFFCHSSTLHYFHFWCPPSRPSSPPNTNTSVDEQTKDGGKEEEGTNEAKRNKESTKRRPRGEVQRV